MASSNINSSAFDTNILVILCNLKINDILCGDKNADICGMENNSWTESVENKKDTLHSRRYIPSTTSSSQRAFQLICIIRCKRTNKTFDISYNIYNHHK